MKRAFLIHGFSGHPRENWFGWLTDQLAQKGVEVIAPQMPNPATPELSAWLKTFEEWHDQLAGSTIIGHSLGVTFLLRLLERVNAQVEQSIFVAGPIADLHDPRFSPHITGFMENTFDWQAIGQRAGEVHIFHSDDDPYVPFEHGEQLAKHLNGKLHLIKNAGHFNERSGYTEFPQLLAAV
jgi:hypothetical protein